MNDALEMRDPGRQLGLLDSRVGEIHELVADAHELPQFRAGLGGWLHQQRAAINRVVTTPDPTALLQRAHEGALNQAAVTPPPDFEPSAVRTIIRGDALTFLAQSPAQPFTSVITSLPDVSELPELGLPAFREWFVGAARAVIRFVPEQGVAIFFQSDIRVGGTWLDKGYLVMKAAELEQASLVWHKIVCRKPPGTIMFGRASYSHMLCISRHDRAMPTRPGPDVLADAGSMPWSKAMGVNACVLACRYLRDETSTRLVVDPFCGHGTALAVANAMGFDALGVDRSARQCRAARKLTVELP